MKHNVIRVFTYLGAVIVSLVFVLATGFNGERVETEQELLTAFPMKTGFPIPFAELRFPHIDPPLPWNYGGDCCSFFITSWTNFLLSVMIVAAFLIVVTEVIFYIKRYRSQ
ncbi:hypothetical protein V1502_10585 [Bacillus sp. SCS-153A]|uniref:hypothetical protein n=1 Tax=Rossellomorea sedimentorum TaxID=3115294 RepID=UPI0039060BE8